MRAVVVTAPGGVEQLTVAEVADPVAGPGEVVLEVAATAVNRTDIMQRMGHYPPPARAPPWLGLEASGTVAALGEGVEGWSVGDHACALLAGGGGRLWRCGRSHRLLRDNPWRDERHRTRRDLERRLVLHRLGQQLDVYVGRVEHEL